MPAIKFNKTNKHVTCDEIIEDDNGITDALLPFERDEDERKIHVQELVESNSTIEIKFKRSTSTFTCKKLIERYEEE